MCTLADEMAAAGKPIDDDELLTYIITSLDMEFNPVVTSLLARKESVTVSEAYSQLLAFETRMEIMGNGHSGSSVNTNRGGVEALVAVAEALAVVAVQDQVVDAATTAPATTSARTTMEGCWSR